MVPPWSFAPQLTAFWLLRVMAQNAAVAATTVCAPPSLIICSSLSAGISPPSAAGPQVASSPLLPMAQKTKAEAIIRSTIMPSSIALTWGGISPPCRGLPQAWTLPLTVRTAKASSVA
ncbi:hypothetical protein D3C86_1537990 [compost metagenome]